MIKDIVYRAYKFAEEAHKDQKRKFTNLPYFTHPKYVARVIEDFTDNPELIAVALLHDVVEDCPKILSKDIHITFGDRIGNLVDELTSEKPSGTSKRKYLTSEMSKMSPDAFLIKLVDRLHNVMFLQSDGVDREFIKKYVLETFYILRHLKRPNTEYNPIEHIVFEKLQSEIVWLGFRYKIELEEGINGN